jgi:hypothetical protein
VADRTPAEKARARFFLGVAQAQGPWRDENTAPLFPLLMVMDAEMLEADAEYEAAWKGARPMSRL